MPQRNPPVPSSFPGGHLDTRMLAAFLRAAGRGGTPLDIVSHEDLACVTAPNGSELWVATFTSPSDRIVWRLDDPAPLSSLAGPTVALTEEDLRERVAIVQKEATRRSIDLVAVNAQDWILAALPNAPVPPKRGGLRGRLVRGIRSITRRS